MITLVELELGSAFGDNASVDEIRERMLDDDLSRADESDRKEINVGRKE